MTSHPAAAGGPEAVTLLRRPAVVSTVLLGGLGLLLLAVVVATDADHLWDGLPTVIGGSVGIGIVSALGGSPIQRGLGGSISRVAPSEVRPRSDARTTVPLLVGTALFCTAFLLWSGDLALLGSAGILGGALGVFELRLIVRWEREHDAHLAVVARTRKERWRLFVWNRRYVAIGPPPERGGSLSC